MAVRATKRKESAPAAPGYREVRDLVKAIRSAAAAGIEVKQIASHDGKVTLSTVDQNGVGWSVEIARPK